MRKSILLSALLMMTLMAACGGDKCKKETKQTETMAENITTINATPQELDGIRKALNAYIEAAEKGDSKIAEPVFAETATISHNENDTLVSGPIKELFDYYNETGPHHAEYEITAAQVAENVAIVSIDSKFGDVGFDDMFTLVKDGNDWKIVSKVFHVK